MDQVIEGEKYQAAYHPEQGVVMLSGILRLNGLEEYAPISTLLSRAVAENGAVTVDLRGLEFLNSSGIAMLSKFVIEARNRQSVALTVHGSRAISWQTKSLPNLQRLMPSMSMELS